MSPPHRLRLSVDGEPVSPRRIVDMADRITSRLHRHGAVGTRPVELRSDSPLTTIAAMLATERLGAPLVLSGSASARAPLPHVRIHDDGSGYPVVVPADDGPTTALPPDTAAVFWTSGTTGDSKAVALSHDALRYQGRATADRMAISDEDRLLLPLPLRHAYAYSVLQVWREKGAHLFVESGFRVRHLMERVVAAGITSLDAVPSMYRLLAAEAGRDPEARSALAGLRIRGCGGDVLPGALQHVCTHALDAPLHDGYGLSESGPNVALTAPGDVRTGTVGRPLDGTQVRIAALGGEIQVWSPSLMSGYVDLRTGALSAAAFTPDGWLRTGDTGALSHDGYLSVTGRIKDVLIIHGETVSPALIEDAVRSAPGVRDVAVVGVPGGTRGDEVHAFVEGGGGAAHDGQLRAVVQSACRRALPAQLRPWVIHVVDELPRNATGKSDRMQLRTRANADATGGRPVSPNRARNNGTSYPDSPGFHDSSSSQEGSTWPPTSSVATPPRRT